MDPKIINAITNVLAIIVALGTVLLDAFSQVPAGSKWYYYLIAIATALIAYFTGKSALSKK